MITVRPDRSNLQIAKGSNDDANRNAGSTPRRDRRPLLDIRGAGAYTGLGERYIRRLRADRSVPCVRIGGRLLFDPDDLDELIERHREPAITGLGSELSAATGTAPAAEAR